MRDRARPILAFAIKTRGVLSAFDLFEFTDDGRADAIRCANKPAGQSVVKVRISEVTPKRKRKP
jgi:hypothetical protein